MSRRAVQRARDSIRAVRAGSGDHKWIPAELVVALVVGAALRLHRLGDESLWIDETFTVVVATELSVRELIVDLPAVEPHPPLYNLLMWGWVRLAGTSEAAVRFPSVVFGVAAIPLLYWLARSLFDRPTAGIATAFLVVAPFQIWYAQEARMYALLVFLTVLSYAALIRASTSYSRQRAVAYVVVATLLGYTHIYGLFVLLAGALFLAWQNASDGTMALSRRRIAGIHAAIAAALSPWLWLLGRRFVADPEPLGLLLWIPDPDPYMLWQAITLFAFGYVAGWYPYWPLPGPPRLLWAVVAGTLGLLAVRWRRGGAVGERRIAEETASLGLVATWLVVPVIVPYLVSVILVPIFVLRYLIVSAPAFLLLLAAGARSASPPGRYLLAALLVTGMLVPLPGYYAADQKDQWREAATFVQESSEPGDTVLVSPPLVAASFEYYFDTPPSRSSRSGRTRRPRRSASGSEEAATCISSRRTSRRPEQTAFSHGPLRRPGSPPPNGATTATSGCTCSRAGRLRRTERVPP